MVLKNLRFIYDQIIYIYIYICTVLDYLYNHQYVGPRTILIRFLDQNLKFMMDPINLDICFY